MNGDERATRGNPFSEDAVLEALLCTPSLYQYALAKGITADHFTDHLNREVWRLILQQREDDLPSDFRAITAAAHEKFSDKKDEDLLGAIREKVTRLGVGGHMSEAVFDYHWDNVAEIHRARQAVETAQRVLDKARSGDDWQEEARKLNEEFSVAHWPPIVDAVDFTGPRKPALPPVLVENLIHRGSKIMVGGTSKGRKTWVLADLAISVAAGVPWWGRRTTQGRVLYLNFEIDAAFFAQRLDTLMIAKNVWPTPGFLSVWNLRGYTEGIERMAPHIIRQLTGQDYSLVIVDPVYKALGDRDENKAGDIASLCNELERIAVKTGAAIGFGAHFSKGNQAGKESIDRVGGSGVWARDPDAILTMTAHEEEDCYTVDSTLRNFPPIDPFVVHWEFPLFRVNEEADPAAIKGAKGGGTRTGRPGPKRDELETLLTQLGPGEALTTHQIRARAAEQMQMPRTTFYRWWKVLEDKGRVRMTAERKWVRVFDNPQHDTTNSTR